MKKTNYLITILFSFLFLGTSIAQEDCEVFCSVTNEFINVCNSAGVVIAADDCADASMGSINDLDGFSTTTCSFTPDGPGGLPNFCGPGTIVHNNMWIAFEPVVSGRLHLNIEIIDCLSPSAECQGIQAAVCRALCANPGNTFFGFESLVCVNCVDQSFDLITVDAMQGVPHYVMIDGCCGDACEIVINVVEGLGDEPWIIEDSSSTACPDILSNCLSPNSTITILLSANEDNNSSGAALTCDWFGPDGQFILQQNGTPVSGDVFFSLTGNDPISNLLYICELGRYSAVLTDPESSWTATRFIDLEDLIIPDLTLDSERINNDGDCMAEEILLTAQIEDPEAEVLFSFWYKVDYGTSPATRVQVSDPTGSNDESLLVSKNDPTFGDGDYIFSFLDRDDFCISEKLISVSFNEEECFADAGDDQVIDCNNQTVTLDGSASCGPTDLIYEWTDPLGIVIISPTIEALEEGTYTLVVTDPNSDCTDTDVVEVVMNFQEPNVNFDFLGGGIPTLSCKQSSIDMLAISDRGDTFLWEFPSGRTSEDNPVNLDEPGTYILITTDLDNGCTSSIPFFFLYDETTICTGAFGKIYWDENDNCTLEDQEQLLGKWLLEFDNGDEVFYRQATIDGNFNEALDPGSYTVSLVPLNETWESCPSVMVEIVEDELTEINFGAKSIKPCPMPIVDMVVPRLRRCVNNAVYLTYSNQGTAEVENVYIDLVLDEYHEMVSSTVNYEDLGADIYRFQIGTLQPFEEGVIKVVVFTDCDAPLSLTHCFESEIFPQNDCFISSDWDGSSLSVAGEQIADKIIFTVTNEGADMTSIVNGYIIEDDVLMRVVPIELNVANGNQLPIEVDCSSSTFRLEVEQAANHPGMSFPCVTIEGCDGQFTPGFVNQFSQDNQDPQKDVACTENVDSFDPNDKLAAPNGVSEAKCIAPGRQLDYTIRFQNTGTAEALKVFITDIVSKNLDMRTLKVTGASHDYVMTIKDERTLVFTFDGINLPWEAKDDLGSNGFIQYSIFPLSDIDLGTEVENNALIYFDFNDPIMTNTTFHTVDENCIEVDLVSSTSESISARSSVYPNPFSNEFTLNIDNTNYEELTFKLFDVNGKKLDMVIFDNNQITYQSEHLHSGIYFYEISAESNTIGSGKLIKL